MKTMPNCEIWYEQSHEKPVDTCTTRKSDRIIHNVAIIYSAFCSLPYCYEWTRAQLPLWPTLRRLTFSWAFSERLLNTHPFASELSPLQNAACKQSKCPFEMITTHELSPLKLMHGLLQSLAGWIHCGCVFHKQWNPWWCRSKCIDSEEWKRIQLRNDFQNWMAHQSFKRECMTLPHICWFANMQIRGAVITKFTPACKWKTQQNFMLAIWLFATCSNWTCMGNQVEAPFSGAGQHSLTQKLTGSV